MSAVKIDPIKIESSKYLLKFRPINERTIELIQSEKIFFALPHQFNDPFEFEKLETPAKLGISSTNGVCSFSASNLPEGEIGNDALDVVFDRSIDNQLMWSHYGDSHKGVCLIFSQERLGEALLDLVDFKPVDYKEKSDPLPEAINYYAKSSIWEYENEIRGVMRKDAAYSNRVEITNSGFLVEFPIKALIGICFGCNTSDVDRQPFYKICAEKIKNRHLDEMLFLKLEKSKKNYALKLAYQERLQAPMRLAHQGF
jgi:hypothetical protein